MNPFRTLLLLAALGTLAAYGLSLSGPFVYDDFDQILRRDELHHFNLHDILFCGLRQIRVWQNLTFALNWAISNNQAWSFKLFNLVLHLTNGTLLYLWLKRIFSDKPFLPVLATALFLIHPLQIQSVSYVMGRVSLLQAFFYLLSLYWFSKYSLNRFVSLMVIVIASLLAKETCFLIPWMLLAYEFTINRTPWAAFPKKKWILLLGSSLIWIPIYLVLKDPQPMYEGTTGYHLYPFFKYLASQLYFQSFYFILFANPSLQSIIHTFPAFTANQILLAVAGALIWLSGLAFLVRRLKSNPRFSFFILFFFINYLPTNSVFPLINPFAEYRLYLSNVSLCVALAYLTIEVSILLATKLKSPKINVILPGSILTFFAIFTFMNALIWKDGIKIFVQAANHYPGEYTIYNNLGNEYLHAHRLREAYFYFSETRYFEGWLKDYIELNEYLVAAEYYKDKDYVNSMMILHAMETDPGRDPLPPPFYELKEEVSNKLNSLRSKANHS